MLVAFEAERCSLCSSQKKIYELAPRSSKYVRRTYYDLGKVQYLRLTSINLGTAREVCLGAGDGEAKDL